MKSKNTKQGMDNSAFEPTLVQDTDYMVAEYYHLQLYLGLFGAYVMPQ